MKKIDIVFLHWANYLFKGNCFFNVEWLVMIVFRPCTQMYSDIYLAFEPFDIITAEYHNERLTSVMINWLIDWLLLNVQWIIFQLYPGREHLSNGGSHLEFSYRHENGHSCAVYYLWCWFISFWGNFSRTFTQSFVTQYSAVLL